MSMNAVCINGVYFYKKVEADKEIRRLKAISHRYKTKAENLQTEIDQYKDVSKKLKNWAEQAIKEL